MNFENLLQQYTLEEVLQRIGIEPIEVLKLLEDTGFDFTEIEEPLE